MALWRQQIRRNPPKLMRMHSAKPVFSREIIAFVMSPRFGEGNFTRRERTDPQRGRHGA